MCDLISVIVPVHNSQKYIHRCIKSITSQTYQNYELILIDDGSIDNSLDICKSYASEKVVVVHKKNEGVSSSRNIGIKIAKGEYIAFCDSDDEVSSDYLERLYDCAAQNPGFLPVCGINIIYPNTGRTVARQAEEAVLPRENFYFLYQQGLFNSPCNKLYESKIVKENNILFDTNISVGEDAVFNLSYVKYIKGFSLIEKPLYNYYIENSSSLDSTFDKKRFDAIEVMYNEFICAIKHLNSSKEAVSVIQKGIIDEYSRAIDLYVSKSHDGFLEKLKAIKEIFNSSAYNSCLSKIDDIFISHNLKLFMKLKSPLLALLCLNLRYALRVKP